MIARLGGLKISQKNVRLSEKSVRIEGGKPPKSVRSNLNSPKQNNFFNEEYDSIYRYFNAKIGINLEILKYIDIF